MAKDENANQLSSITPMSCQLSLMVKLVSSYPGFFLETSKKPL